MKQRDTEAQPRGPRGLSRRSLLGTGLALAGGMVGALGGTRSSSAEAKLPQNQVSYQASPKNGKRCADCVNYQGENTCRVVAGDISPEGWCRLWNAR